MKRLSEAETTLSNSVFEDKHESNLPRTPTFAEYSEIRQLEECLYLRLDASEASSRPRVVATLSRVDWKTSRSTAGRSSPETGARNRVVNQSSSSHDSLRHRRRTSGSDRSRLCRPRQAATGSYRYGIHRPNTYRNRTLSGAGPRSPSSLFRVYSCGLSTGLLVFVGSLTCWSKPPRCVGCWGRRARCGGYREVHHAVGSL